MLGPVSVSGTLEIGPSLAFFLNGHYTYAGVPLELTGATSTNVVFDDGHGILILDNVAAFTGTITPADTGDRIIVKGTSLASVTSYDYVGDSHGGTLTVHTTGGDFNLRFLGDFTRADFSLTAGPRNCPAIHRAWSITNTDMGPHAPHDFNADGSSDILWRHDAGVVTWEMNDGMWSRPNPSGRCRQLAIAGTGDFNGDGPGRHPVAQQCGPVVHLADERRPDSHRSLARARQWHVAGPATSTATAATTSCGATMPAARSRPGLEGGQPVTPTRSVSAPTDWKIAGTGDFNGDGHDDILWRNDNGQSANWVMDDGSHRSAPTPSARAPTNWHIAGTGDFNGDGTERHLLAQRRRRPCRSGTCTTQRSPTLGRSAWSRRTGPSRAPATTTYSSGVGRLVELQVSGEDLALRLALRSVDAGRSSGRG